MRTGDWSTHDLPPDTERWVARAEDLCAAWRECPRAEWLVELCLGASLGRAVVVRAAAGVVAEALGQYGADGGIVDLRVHRGLVTVLAWVGGRASANEAWAAAFGALEVADALSRGEIGAMKQQDVARAEAAARAVAHLAFACDEEADEVFYAHRGYLAKAMERAAVVIGSDEAAADRMRAEVPLAHFLQAVEASAERRTTVLEAVAAETPATDSFYC
ncbi:MAG: hypothetical protein AB7S26_10315 [Sandaracinaceae bacterium]